MIVIDRVPSGCNRPAPASTGQPLPPGAGGIMPDLLIFPVPNGTRVECLWCAEGTLLTNTTVAAARAAVEGLAGLDHECKGALVDAS